MPFSKLYTVRRIHANDVHPPFRHHKVPPILLYNDNTVTGLYLPQVLPADIFRLWKPPLPDVVADSSNKQRKRYKIRSGHSSVSTVRAYLQKACYLHLFVSCGGGRCSDSHKILCSWLSADRFSSIRYRQPAVPAHFS